MSTADKLNALVQTKADIKQALIDKGQNPSDVFSTYADDIRAIETGAKLPIPKETKFTGSTWDNGIPQEILDYINDPNNISLSSDTMNGILSHIRVYNQTEDLYFSPTLSGYFLYQSYIRYTDDITETTITYDCKNIIDTVGRSDLRPALFGDSGFNVGHVNDYNLRATIKFLNTSRIARFNGVGQDMSEFIRITGLDFSSCEFGNDKSFSGNWVNNLEVSNLGKHQSFTVCKNFVNLYRWGLDGDDFRWDGGKNSLIYSLITNSYDRASAGYDPCAITLSSDTKGVLTEEEIAQITAKGYTIA